jgi:hypothetical protein
MPSRLAAALVAALALPAAAWSQPAPRPRTEIVERIVAVADERPILLSDLLALRAVRGLSEEQALPALVDERLMYVEAARLPQAEVFAEEEDRALEILVLKRPALRAEVQEPDLRRLLRRQIAILKYVEFRFRPQVRVSDAEVRKAWEEEQAGRPAGPAFEDEQEEVRARLERRALDDRIEAWVGELRQRADVRYVGGAPSAPPGAP